MTATEKGKAMLKRFKAKKPMLPVSTMLELKKGDMITFKQADGSESLFIIKKVKRRKRFDGKMEIVGFVSAEVVVT